MCKNDGVARTRLVHLDLQRCIKSQATVSYSNHLVVKSKVKLTLSFIAHELVVGLIVHCLDNQRIRSHGSDSK